MQTSIIDRGQAGTEPKLLKSLEESIALLKEQNQALKEENTKLKKQ